MRDAVHLAAALDVSVTVFVNGYFRQLAARKPSDQ